MASGGELVVRTLRAAGVERVFGLHGAHIDSIFQAALDAGLPIIDTRNEATAGHAAEGYARTAHKLGVALVTAGGGMTNVVTPLAQAFMDRTPILVIAGSGPVRDDETNTLQATIDQVAIATPVTKWAHRVRAVEHIPRLLAQAIRIANTAPRGPVLIDIPWDLLTAEIDDDAPAKTEIFFTAGNALGGEDQARCLDILRNAKRPVILVGSEAKRGRAHAGLKKLIARTGIPVFADFEGLSVISEIPPTHRGGLVQQLWGLAAKGEAPDAVLLLGVRFGLNTAHGTGALIPHDARVIQIDPDGRELGRLQGVELGVTADVAPSVAALAETAESADWPDFSGWRESLRSHADLRRAKILANAGKTPRLHPFEASQVLARHIGPETIVVADGALTYLWLSEVISDAAPGEFLCHGYLGSMGVGFGLALGAQSVGKGEGRRTILVTGDGSIGFALAEFDSVVRHGLPVIVVVMNNRSWGATLHFQELAVGLNRVTNTRLDNGSYDAAAIALGADGYHVADAAAFDKALGEALSKDRPACINVEVDLAPIPPEEMLLIGLDPFKDPETKS
jgi:acetolactate synthase-1/2/3 large subunit